MNIKLSISMIMKNEERYILDCLRSIKDVADEIVIVDTGSTDRTIELAVRFAAKEKVSLKLYHYSWNNNFAEARNFSLLRCSGNWILYIDADERLSPYSVETINAIKSIDDKYAYHLQVRSLGNIQTVVRSPRLFRNSKEVYFENGIHEQIGPSLLRQKYKFFLSSAIINHIGYDISDAALRQKAERNLALLQKEPVLDDGHYYHLGETYFALEDWDAAAHSLILAIAKNSLSNEITAHCYCMLVQIDYNRGYSYADNFIKAVATDPESPEPYFIYAELQAAKRNYEIAANNYKYAIANNRIRRYPFFQIVYDKKYLNSKLKVINER